MGTMEQAGKSIQDLQVKVRCYPHTGEVKMLFDTEVYITKDVHKEIEAMRKYLPGTLITEVNLHNHGMRYLTILANAVRSGSCDSEHHKDWGDLEVCIGKARDHEFSDNSDREQDAKTELFKLRDYL